MRTILLITAIISIIVSCRSTRANTNDGTPDCINKMIDSFKIEAKQNPPRSITQYTYKGRAVFYITSPCCDQFNIVVDSMCNMLGSPDGGFTGRGDGKLPSFANEATEMKLIWKDQRDTAVTK